MPLSITFFSVHLQGLVSFLITTCQLIWMPRTEQFHKASYADYLTAMSACNTEGYVSFYDLEIDPKAGTNFDWVSRLIFFSAIDIECDRIWRSLMHWNCDNLIAAAVAAASAFTNYQLVKLPFRGRVKNSLFWGRLQKLWNFSENLLPTVCWKFSVTYLNFLW